MQGIEFTTVQSQELATSTCTPTGGGASQCVYSYKPSTSYSTTTTYGTSTISVRNIQEATTTQNVQTVTTVWLLIMLAVIVVLGTALTIKKLT